DGGGESSVGGQGGICQHLNDVGRACLRYRIGAVHSTFDLIGGFCQVDGDFLTAYRHSGGNGDIYLFDTVVLEVVRKRARSIGKAAYCCARSALAVGNECVT